MQGRSPHRGHALVGGAIAAVAALALVAAGAPSPAGSELASLERPLFGGEPAETIESGDEHHGDEPDPVSPAVDLAAGLNRFTDDSPWAGRWGPDIEPLAAYEPQRFCMPGPRPAVVRFAALLERAHPQGRSLGVTRACESGARSEHKEGRAYDWGLNVTVPAERVAADQVLAWLLATDEHGNRFAMARRLGIMYVIWDGHIWSAAAADDGWRVYTGPSPHTDHVHLSFGWQGAMGLTSFWDATGLDLGADPDLFGGFSLDDLPSRFHLGGERYRRELGARPGSSASWDDGGSAEPTSSSGQPAPSGDPSVADDGADPNDTEPAPSAPIDPAPAPGPEELPSLQLPDLDPWTVIEPTTSTTTIGTVTTTTLPLLDDLLDAADETGVLPTG